MTLALMPGSQTRFRFPSRDRAPSRGHDGPVDDRYEAVDLTVERTRGLSVTFADGHLAEIDLMRLRLSCPCAACRSLRERGEAPWPQHSHPDRLSINDAQLHGAWGLNVTWSDGHSTGIYSFELLRKLSETENQ